MRGFVRLWQSVMPFSLKTSYFAGGFDGLQGGLHPPLTVALLFGRSPHDPCLNRPWMEQCAKPFPYLIGLFDRGLGAGRGIDQSIIGADVNHTALLPFDPGNFAADGVIRRHNAKGEASVVSSNVQLDGQK